MKRVVRAAGEMESVQRRPDVVDRVRVTDAVLAAVHQSLGLVPPERGGALMGFGDLVHVFVDDSAGAYSGASWDISAELGQTVAAIEDAMGGWLRGTVHSHPRGIADPSSTDVESTALALRLNPHLDDLLTAVVTEGEPREHDVPLGPRHRMSVHRMRRDPVEGYVFERVGVDVVPVADDLAHGGLGYRADTSVASYRDGSDPDRLDSVLAVGRRDKLVVPIPSRQPRALLIDALHPTVAPVVVACWSGEGGPPVLSPLPSSWDVTVPSGPQLSRLVRRSTHHGLERTFDRVAELVGDLNDKVVVVVGAGSVGSRIAEDLVRSGLGSISLVDPDEVVAANLSRSVYTTEDVGEAKVTALARRLTSINPDLEVRAEHTAIRDVEWSSRLRAVDLVVAATDDMAEQAGLSHHVFAAGIAMVACALYRRAAAGEVVLSVPGADTSCWACSIGYGTSSSTYRPDTDYGLDARLVAESALGPSINVVASVASQVAVGLLAGPASVAGAPLARLIADRRTLGVIATSPRWAFFDEVFDGMGHQFHPQSVWAAVQRNAACPVCGDNRQPPMLRADGVEVLAALHDLAEDERRSRDLDEAIDGTEAGTPVGSVSSVGSV